MDSHPDVVDGFSMEFDQRKGGLQAHQGSESEVDRIMPILSEFRPAGMELLAQRELNSRSDWKFVLSTERLGPILSEMCQSHAVLLAGESRIGRYRSRYYDSQTMQCYQDHRRGVPCRFKLRHRHYLDRALTMFEIKAKTPRGDTFKNRVKVPFVDHGGRLNTMCREFASGFLGISMDGFAPSLDNSFNRITLLAYESQERVTIDLDLSFSKNGQRVQLPGLVVFEVKSASPRHLTPSLRRLAQAGLRPQRMSKYCAGITLLDAGITPSWFATLRRRIYNESEPMFETGN